MTKVVPHGRKIFVALIFAVLIVVLDTCARELEEETVAQQESGVLAPMFEVDPFWPQPLPNHWLLGAAVGISVDSRDHVWVVHRQASLNARTEIGAAADPAHRRMLYAGAQSAGVRSCRQLGRTLGRPWRGLRLAQFKPRGHHRSQGQRLDRRQRPRGRSHPQVHSKRPNS